MTRCPERDLSLDAIAGFFVLWMVVLHTIQYNGETNSFFYKNMGFLSFFMPWFFFKGGIFFKGKNRREVIFVGVKRLIFPYIWGSLIGFILLFIRDYSQLSLNSIETYARHSLGYFAWFGSFQGNLPLWFLLSLFIVRLIVNEAYVRNIPIWIVGCLGLLFSVTGNYLNLALPVYVFNICSGLFYFSMGNLLKKTISTRLAVACCLLFLTISIFARPEVDMRTNTLLMGFYFLWPLWSLCGIVTLNNIVNRCRFLQPKFLVFLGIRSMTIYVLHWPVLMLLKILVEKFFLVTELKSLMLILVIECFICIIWFFQRKMS